MRVGEKSLIYYLFVTQPIGFALAEILKSTKAKSIYKSRVRLEIDFSHDRNHYFHQCPRNRMLLLCTFQGENIIAAVRLVNCYYTIILYEQMAVTDSDLNILNNNDTSVPFIYIKVGAFA